MWTWHVADGCGDIDDRLPARYWKSHSQGHLGDVERCYCAGLENVFYLLVADGCCFVWTLGNGWVQDEAFRVFSSLRTVVMCSFLVIEAW